MSSWADLPSPSLAAEVEGEKQTVSGKFSKCGPGSSWAVSPLPPSQRSSMQGAGNSLHPVYEEAQGGLGFPGGPLGVPGGVGEKKKKWNFF